MATKKCPVCEVPVKFENLERHVRNQHPHADVDLRTLLTDEERAATTRAKRASARPAITRKGATVVAVVALVLGALLVLVIVNPFGNVGPGIGQTAPTFSIRSTMGTTISLSSYRDAVVVLEFMDVDCPACNDEAPTLVALHQNYSATVRFLSIDVNFVAPSDDDAKINEWASSHGANWPFALDVDGSVRRMYGVTSTPTTFVLDRDGVVRAIVHPPANSYGDFVAAIAAASGA
jgi:peroxiredoxin